ncbi:MAG: EAL domain-containing protein [Eubacterium sp.]|nr:EAL domain-containing protein [Eubacterium sp.]
MFTWNFQHISKNRLVETFEQLKLDESDGDILVRIHTASHFPDEAVELARYIKSLVPDAKIFGTSTSAIISNGKLIPDQCLISITQMSRGHIRTARFSTLKNHTDNQMAYNELCEKVKEAVIGEKTKFLLTFLTAGYFDVYRFVEKSNELFPGVKMFGGLADGPGSGLSTEPQYSFIFDENGWDDDGIILAAIDGGSVDSLCLYATGVEPIGEEMEVTDTFSTLVMEVNGIDAGKRYEMGIGSGIGNNPNLTCLFPFAYVDSPDFPVYVSYIENKSIEDIFPKSNPANRKFYDEHPDIDTKEKKAFIKANHYVKKGQKFRKAFIFDKKIISDNRALFRKIESFEKAETIFAYSCIVRSTVYSNCVKWELSAYENSNMSGCITFGEIVNDKGVNRFVNGSFVVAVLGEDQATQVYNPYSFMHAETLYVDNNELLRCMTIIEQKANENKDNELVESMRAYVRDCESKILSSDELHIPNEAALNMDIGVKGVDRICMIEVSGITSMKTVFSTHLIDLTFKNYISKCENFAKSKNYRIYHIKDWTLAIGAQSYRVALSEFTKDMEELQKILFYNDEKYIAIVPAFSVLDNCTVENYNNAYNSAKIRMWQKNLQFYSVDADEDLLDENVIKENYHMVDVVNYAIANNKVIPHFQGIYDNKKKCITHYEALMRLEDENGKLYYPNSFLDVARTYGVLYDSISKSMIQKVFEMFKGAEEYCVSINLGVRDIRNKELIDYIYDFLSTVKYPSHFIFELLENEDIDDYNSMIEFVDKIHELGGKISIDDFGSGFSNLQHVINLEVDILKIDGSIVRNCCDNAGAENLLALIATWKGLTNDQVQIVAEFVENEEIQNKLLSYDIDYSQGYFFSKPSADIDIK